jgi:tRNA threonylcarbamoyladenosine biosynthesis protein TsaE
MAMVIRSLENIDQIAEKFLSENKESRIFAFYGPMGSGKTTFIKALCKQLQVVDTVNSPTFTIINEYISSNNQKIFHFDFYRITKEEEFYDIGYEDYFYTNDYCFIEWPEIIEQLLPINAVKYKIEEMENGARELKKI